MRATPGKGGSLHPAWLRVKGSLRERRGARARARNVPSVCHGRSRSHAGTGGQAGGRGGEEARCRPPLLVTP
eukprot:4371880-Prymnesium_polylepis.1